jgi:hypothetical protein
MSQECRQQAFQGIGSAGGGANSSSPETSRISTHISVERSAGFPVVTPEDFVMG